MLYKPCSCLLFQTANDMKIPARKNCIFDIVIGTQKFQQLIYTWFVF